MSADTDIQHETQAEHVRTECHLMAGPIARGEQTLDPHERWRLLLAYVYIERMLASEPTELSAARQYVGMVWDNWRESCRTSGKS